VPDLVTMLMPPPFDGASDVNPRSTTYLLLYTPNVDAVAEFKVQTNSMSAEYGRTGMFPPCAAVSGADDGVTPGAREASEVGSRPFSGRSTMRRVSITWPSVTLADSSIGLVASAETE
jgi:hypothetical protein